MNEPDDRSFARKRQSEIYLGDLQGKRPSIPTRHDRLRNRTADVLSARAFAYIVGSAGYESTAKANREAFVRYRIIPRMLNDVSSPDSSIELFGRSLPVPFLFGPVGVLEMAHREADLAVARAAAAEGIPFIFSSQASVDMETCSKAMEDSPRWFQLYWSKNNALVESFVRRAERCGCEAIVLTLDTTMLGWRPRDLDLAYLPFLRGKGIAQYTSDPEFLEMLQKQGSGDEEGESKKITYASIKALVKMSRRFPGSFWKNMINGLPLKAIRTFIETYSRPSLTWQDLSLLRELTDLPILLKGILHPGDARKAVEHEMDGIIVSNHGGRQVDGAIASLEALPGIVDAVEGRIPVLFDSGIRSGSDMVKALALGARAVLVGRPYVYALALAGEKGVSELARNLRAEFELNMALAGCHQPGELSREHVQITS